MTTSPIDVWLNTNISEIPFCHQQEACYDIFRRHFVESVDIVHGVGWYADRVECLTKVKATGQFLNLVGNISANGTSIHGNPDSGELYFSGFVCVCDTNWGFSGQQCDISWAGLAMRYALYGLMLWYIFLFLRIGALLVSGHFKSIRKKILALVALLLYTNQLIWVFGTRAAVRFVPGTPTRELMTQVGFTMASLASFMFLCGLMLETTVFIRLDSTKRKNKNEVRKLRRVERIFKTLPLAIGLLTAVLFASRNPSAVTTLAVVQMTAMAFVAVAFTTTIRAIDLRLRRLAPSADNMNLQSDGSQEFLKFSRRLRSMARRMQLVVLGCEFFGAIYIAFLIPRSAQSGIATSLLFGIWQFFMSLIPFVGLPGLMTIKVKGQTKTGFVSRTAGWRNRPPSDVVESSDCGTLGG
jgi:hypothetical protein